MDLKKFFRSASAPPPAKTAPAPTPPKPAAPVAPVTPPPANVPVPPVAPARIPAPGTLASGFNTPPSPAENDPHSKSASKESTPPCKLAQSLSSIKSALSDASQPTPLPAASAIAPLTQSRAMTAAANSLKARDISLYKSLLGGLYDGVLILDAKGGVIASNRRAEQFLGYTEQELWGMQCEELVVGINTRVLYKLHAHAEEGRFTVVNGTCKRKDGTSFPAEIAISRIRLLNEGDLIFSIRNIERREKVREQRGLEEEAVRSTGAGVAVCSIEGAIEFANPAFLKILGQPNEQEVIKHMIGDFCSSYEQVNTMMHAPSPQGNWLGTLELVTPKGLKREVLVTAALSQLHRGATSRIVLTMIPLPKAVR